MARLFDELCLSWAREADLLVQQAGSLAPTLVLLPRDPAAAEVAVRVEGLRGNLAERAGAILADLRPAVAPHQPAGLVFLADMRIAPMVDGAVVYVSLGTPDLRRLLAFTPVPDADLTRLEPADTTLTADDFAWLDALLGQPPA